jgi:hypothetical protein
MSLMTSPASARPRTARRAATLTLTIDGVPFDVRAFDTDGDGLGGTGVDHSLCGPDGLRFHVFGCVAGCSDDCQQFCERCESDDCPHISALEDVGLM